MQRSERFDVAVIGGGTAGVAAAVAAAGCGARTLLVERSKRLGGNVANALVHTICGLYEPAGDGPACYAQDGFARAFAERLRASGGAGEPQRAGRVRFLPIQPGAVAALAAELCTNARGLEWTTDSAVVGAELDPDATGTSLLRIDGDRTLREAGARVVVDASGDGIAGALAGADFDVATPDLLQHPSYVFVLADVDTAALEGFARLRLSHAVTSAVRSGSLPPGCESIVVRPGIRPREVYATMTLPKPAEGSYDPLDDAWLTDLAARAREHATAVAEFLRDTREAFARCRLAESAERIGVRETRRLLGRRIVTAEDVLSGRRSDDEVAVSSWPIELWHDHRRATFEHPAGPSSVPLGALISRSHGSLAMAGRCLSATHEAHGALRVIGTAMATGEAAGVAAALAADAGVALAEIAPSAVRQQIHELNAR